MAKVFVVYSRKDIVIVEDIIKCLESAGHSVWYDKKIKPKSGYPDDEINNQLDFADTVLVCWSSASRQAKYVKAEAKTAEYAEKLLSVRLNNCKIPVPYNNHIWYDLFPSEENCKAPAVQLVIRACQ